MTERNDLLASIAQTISDYRSGEVEKATPTHVDRWIEQFEKGTQLQLLKEIDHVLSATYLGTKKIEIFLSSMLNSEALAGKDPRTFWARAHFLKIQKSGHSQAGMLDTVDRILRGAYNLGVDTCGDIGGDYVYVDDIMFSGNRIGHDLESWIATTAPPLARVHVIVAVIHTSGRYLTGNRLDKVIAESGKKVELKFWRNWIVENRKYYKNDSAVLWPAEVPADTATRQYLALPHRFPLELRTPGGALGPFSSEQGRQLLERELLVAGVKIRGLSHAPKEILRPLGFSPFGAGFGALTVTHRNCPNNCPLALWWGNPRATAGPFHWYPLLPRKTYAQSLDSDATSF